MRGDKVDLNRLAKARDKVCPGCGGKGGKHAVLHCAYLRDELDRMERKMAGEGRQNGSK